ncbi:MAG: hypothetical protein FWH20_02850 [Oscillospiraceae bacterium]|nr:hypothetical protein [Oscillospiraceae bacterium]
MLVFLLPFLVGVIVAINPFSFEFYQQVLVIFGAVIVLQIILVICQSYSLKKTAMLYHPDDKIKRYKRFLFVNTTNFRKPLNTAGSILRRNVMSLVAQAHAEKGDYAAALEVNNEIWRNLKPSFHKRERLSGNELGYYGVKIECLLRLGNESEAEELLNTMLTKQSADYVGEIVLNFTHAEYHIHKRNPEAAREAVSRMRTAVENCQKQGYAHPAIAPFLDYDVILQDAKTDVIEGLYDDARAKFTDIIENCNYFGHKRVAEKELEACQTRS